MSKTLLISAGLLFIIGCKTTKKESTSAVVSSDIDLFWNAYDQITTTSDTAQQRRILHQEYFDKGSEGLIAMRRVRRYTDTDYLEAIRSYPKFWEAMRPQTMQAHELKQGLSEGIEKLRKLYPSLKPAKIYYTIGALRSNGTTLEDAVLVGSELAFANAHTPTHELPESFSYLRSYFDSNPGENIVFLNIHEYVHTQQQTTIGSNLLAQTVIEGVAEFTAELAMNTSSPNPQIAFGKEHDQRIKDKFTEEMFSPFFFNWLWNSSENEFGMRDLAYYVGYAICEKYYSSASDKAQAIKSMIELDYNNIPSLMAFVDSSGYFNKPTAHYQSEYEKMRPSVTRIEGFSNGSQDVSAELSQLTIHFSEPMDSRFRSFEYGPLGEDHSLQITGNLTFSKDGTSVSFDIAPLQPGKQYELTIGERFASEKGYSLKPYLIEFRTK